MAEVIAAQLRWRLVIYYSIMYDQACVWAYSHKQCDGPSQLFYRVWSSVWLAPMPDRMGGSSSIILSCVI